jgi:hypothetical protein
MSRFAFLFSFVLFALTACADDEPLAHAVETDSDTSAVGGARSPTSLARLDSDLDSRAWNLGVMVDPFGTQSSVQTFVPPADPAVMMCSISETPAGRVIALGSSYGSSRSICTARAEGNQLTIQLVAPGHAPPLLVRTMTDPMTREGAVGLVGGNFIGLTDTHLIARDAQNRVIWRVGVGSVQSISWSSNGTLVVQQIHQFDSRVVPEMRAIDPRNGRTVASRSMQPTLLNALNKPIVRRIPKVMRAQPSTDETLVHLGVRIEADDTRFPYLEVDAFDANNDRLWRRSRNNGKGSGRIATSVAGDHLVVHELRANLGREWNGRSNVEIFETVVDVTTGEELAQIRANVVFDGFVGPVVSPGGRLGCP